MESVRRDAHVRGSVHGRQVKDWLETIIWKIQKTKENLRELQEEMTHRVASISQLKNIKIKKIRRIYFIWSRDS